MACGGEGGIGVAKEGVGKPGSVSEHAGVNIEEARSITGKGNAVTFKIAFKTFDESAFALAFGDSHKQSDGDDGEQEPDAGVEIDDEGSGIDTNDEAGGDSEDVEDGDLLEFEGVSEMKEDVGEDGAKEKNVECPGQKE